MKHYINEYLDMGYILKEQATPICTYDKNAKRCAPEDAPSTRVIYTVLSKQQEKVATVAFEENTLFGHYVFRGAVPKKNSLRQQALDELVQAIAMHLNGSLHEVYAKIIRPSNN